MRSDWIRENDFCKNFSSVFISHVRCTFHENFVLLCGMARSLPSITIFIREKELEEQNWGCSNTKAKKSIIEFCEGLPCPEDYSNPLSPKLVIIGDLREKNRHRATQSWIFSSKAVIAKSLLLQNLFHQRRVQRYIV